MVVLGKKGASFVETIGLIGAIMIFVGVVWIIAYNWEEMPDFLKISILVISVLASFSSGIILRHQDYEKIGRALLILGALLYIASIFLIAQIFNVSLDIQTTAWLFLLCWVGIILSAYALDSPENVFVSMIAFLIWFALQFLSFAQETEDFSGGILTFGFLGIGILFFGLNLLHRNTGHKFARVYQFWSVFYFLVIAFLISSMSIMLRLWDKGFSSNSPTFFTFSVFAFSLLIFLIGVAVSVGKSVTGKEIFYFVLIVLAFIVFIGLIYFVSGNVGTCYSKTCYDFKTSSQCSSAPFDWFCKWEGNSCFQESCEAYSSNESFCNSAPSDLDCKWINDSYYWRCEPASRCDTLPSEAECNASPRCEWGSYDGRFGGGYCFLKGQNDNNKDCRQNDNLKEDCLDNDLCRWNSSPAYDQELPSGIWAFWIILNIFFMAFLLLCIYYGYFLKMRKIVTLSFVAFILQILYKFIEYARYTTLGLGYTFVIGGVFLLVLGWLILKWKKDFSVNWASSEEKK